VSKVRVEVHEYWPEDCPLPDVKIVMQVDELPCFGSEVDVATRLLDKALRSLWGGQGMSIGILPSDQADYDAWVKRLAEEAFNQPALERTKIAQAFQKVIDRLYK